MFSSCLICYRSFTKGGGKHFNPELPLWTEISLKNSPFAKKMFPSFSVLTMFLFVRKNRPCSMDQGIHYHIVRAPPLNFTANILEIHCEWEIIGLEYDYCILSIRINIKYWLHLLKVFLTLVFKRSSSFICLPPSVIVREVFVTFMILLAEKNSETWCL